MPVPAISAAPSCWCSPNAARGSAKAIRTGHPGWDLIPLVCGIGRTPGTPPEGGRFAAELVLLRIITGELPLGSHDDRMFALAAIRGAPPPRRLRYARYIRALAPSRARKPLEELMKTVLKDDFMDGLIEEGIEKGRAEMLLDLLEKRFTVPAKIRKRVAACTDTDQIKAWFDRAISASSLDEVFAKLPPFRRSLIIPGHGCRALSGPRSQLPSSVDCSTIELISDRVPIAVTRSGPPRCDQHRDGPGPPHLKKR
jgi:hypothetical protein